MSWIQNLQQRWNAKSVWQVIAILLCFALTGTTIVWLMKPMLRFIFGNEVPLWAKIIYYVFILPIYNLVLLFYGFLFGQFSFFLAFEKRLFEKIVSIFQKR